MDASINYLQRDCGSLKSTIDTNRTAMNEGGFTEPTYTAFIEDTDDLKVKETAQQIAVKDAEDKTAQLNEIITNTQKLVSDVKAAAKSAYGKDARNLNAFNIGADIP
jgi:hypothetical protein